MAKGKKRKQIPEVLWRLFHKNARTLSDTVMSLLPSPPRAVADCQCEGRRCLGCTGDKAMAYLIRPKDPADYRKLLNQCFVVIPDQAPPFTSFDPHNRWSQLETVRRTIEMISREQPSSSNVLCIGYDKTNRQSSMVEHLTSSAWCLLLRRVGDNLMVYLLRYALIFLPFPPRKHHQVAGFPISNLCMGFLKHSSKFRTYPSKFNLGSGKKRKRVDGTHGIENPARPSHLDNDLSSSSSSCIGCSGGNSFAPSSRCCRQKLFEKTEIHRTEIPPGAECLSNEASFPGNFCENSTRVLTSKKRKRKYSWQRHRKPRNLCSQESVLLVPCRGSHKDKDNSCAGPQYGVETNSGFYSQKGSCSCCLVFGTLSKVSRKSLIDRQTIFYKAENSPSIFPRKHILNSVKSNYSGAKVLFKDIFGSSDNYLTDPSVLCVHGTKSCFIKSPCLYHSLMKQLKILIRNVKGCQPKSLLEKHCGMSSLEQHVKTSKVFQGSESGGLMHNKNQTLHALDLSSKKFTRTNSESCTKIPKAHDQLQSSMGYCLKKQVVSFIWAVCRSIVPQDLLGSPYNWRILRKNISKFVSLRKFEKFSLKQCTHKLKISKFPLLSNKHSLCYVCNNDFTCDQRDSPVMLQNSNKKNSADVVRHKLLQCWILWFFSRLVVPLMEANFYITESENGKQEVYYYRMNVWQKLKDQALGSLEDGGYHKLTDASVHDIIRYRSFGFSKIRFRPRDTGFRVLANLRAPSRIPFKSFDPRNVKYKYYKSVNNVLQGVHAVLKGIQLKEPEKLGSSVFDYTDVYKRFVPFVNSLKRGSSTMPAVYVIVSDVSKAFDSIDQNRLLNVMEDVISLDAYPLSKSLQVGCTRKSFMVCQNLMLPLQEPNSRCSASPSPVPISTPHGILVKEVKCFLPTLSVYQVVPFPCPFLLEFIGA
ncbi:OLC1v1001530C2 [Oldenlandia corymbosa var. corymbosa]|uniref:Telomerase reverse transcriptase n=1 Tax=Oldenlandia corymbosa var. corymbosa TaxID=529605 RepID=A0AAV1D6M0_OLDCO|nr:OLC1v1001530C2 [Oldenlandia corymbosa var. corymbosa]